MDLHEKLKKAKDKVRDIEIEIAKQEEENKKGLVDRHDEFVKIVKDFQNEAQEMLNNLAVKSENLGVPFNIPVNGNCDVYYWPASFDEKWEKLIREMSEANRDDYDPNWDQFNIIGFVSVYGQTGWTASHNC